MYETIKSIRTLVETPRWIAVYKPSGLPSQSVHKTTATLLTTLQAGFRSEIFLPLRLPARVEGIALIALDRGISAQLSRMLQRGEILKQYRVMTDGRVEISDRPQGERVQLAMLRFHDPLGKDEEIEIQVDEPKAWTTSDILSC